MLGKKRAPAPSRHSSEDFDSESSGSGTELVNPKAANSHTAQLERHVSSGAAAAATSKKTGKGGKGEQPRGRIGNWTINQTKEALVLLSGLEEAYKAHAATPRTAATRKQFVRMRSGDKSAEEVLASETRSLA